jgi:hypothetical protein
MNLKINFMQQQGHHSIYIYGIIDGRFDKDVNAKGLGDGDDKVYFVPFKDVMAVVSNTPFIEYDPSEENTLAHEMVIQEILKQELTIAPMRFCTILKTRNDLMKLLHSAYLPFKRNILKIRNKLEFDAKVFLDIEKLKAEVGNGKELLNKSKDIAMELNVRLKKRAEDMVLAEQITDDMIMNASFLIHKEKIKDFYDEVNKFDKLHTDKLKIRISGPTAPYNFVDMPIR